KRARSDGTSASANSIGWLAILLGGVFGEGTAEVDDRAVPQHPGPPVRTVDDDLHATPPLRWPGMVGSGSLRTQALEREDMAVVETERHGQILVVRMNRPERLNALSQEMRTRLAEAWTEFRRSNELEVAIFTGAGRAFCAGEDMKESLQRGQPGGVRPD